MEQWIEKTEKIIAYIKKKPGILVLIFALLFSLTGVFNGYYIRKNGVYITATILNAEHAPRGYVIYIKYSYRYRPYQTYVSADMDLARKENIGKRLIFAVLPNHPTMIQFIKYAPKCLEESPPKGWIEIPKCEYQNQ